MFLKFSAAKQIASFSILLLLVVGIFVISFFSVNNKKIHKSFASTSCSGYKTAGTCTSAGCTWGVRKYCSDFYRASECESHGGDGCVSRACTTGDCEVGTRGCSFTGNYCSPIKGSPCAGLSESECTLHSSDWSCRWNARSCSGNLCFYNGSNDPGFIVPGCTGTPAPTVRCSPDNPTNVQKLVCDITSCWWENTTCPSGQICDLSSSTYCTNAVCNTGQERCSADGYFIQACSSTRTSWINSRDCRPGRCANTAYGYTCI